MSLGGVLGGLFNALVAPLVFTRLIEYPLAMILACALSPQPAGIGRWLAKFMPGERSPWRWLRVGDLVIPILVGLTAGLVYFYWPYDGDRKLRAALAVALCLPWIVRPVCFGLSIGAVSFVMTSYYDVTSRVEYRERSFYGALKVTQDIDPPINYLSHGHIRHGAQLRDDDPKRARPAPGLLPSRRADRPGVRRVGRSSWPAASWRWSAWGSARWRPTAIAGKS